MKNKILLQKYIKFFETILKEKNKRQQREIAKQIADFSAKVNDEVEKKYWDKPIQEIQSACLPIEHQEDETDYCNLTKEDIKDFLKQLNV